MAQRPQNFRLNRNHLLHKGLVFAGLGGGASTLQMTDASGYGNNGTLTEMTPPTDWVWVPELGRWVIGKISGTTSRGVKTASISHNIGTGNYAVTAWAMTTDISKTYSPIMGFEGWDPGWFLTRSSTNQSFCYHDGFLVHSSGITIQASKWYHLAFCRISGVLYLYIDGVLRTWTNSVSSVDNGRMVLLDANYGLDGNSAMRVGDPMLYTRALTTAEIAVLANPADPMLGGLVLPPRRKWWPVSSGATPPAFKAAWARKTNNLIGSGVA